MDTRYTQQQTAMHTQSNRRKPHLALFTFSPALNAQSHETPPIQHNAAGFYTAFLDISNATFFTDQAFTNFGHSTATPIPLT
ncbi:MAG: hypothetical protein KBD60_10405 [Sterolibacterium sp.]|jgi:hypothetical protein|nr:hypothetical protein [Sterolibacterium sp.]